MDRTSRVLLLLGLIHLGLSLIVLLTEFKGGTAVFLIIFIAQFLLYLKAVTVVLDRPHMSGRALFVVLSYALLFRAVLTWTDPYLSTDIYRYVWDGKVAAAGVNPYRYIPEAPELAPLRDSSIFPRINRRDYAKTIYPPVSQFMFLLEYRLAPSSIAGMKLMMAAFDCGTILLLMLLLRRCALPVHRVIVYAWSPLPIWEFAHSGHVDAIAVCLITAAALQRSYHRPVRAGVFLGLATGVKLYPALLIPVFSERRDWKLPLTALSVALLSYVPYLSAGTGVFGFLPLYVREEGLRDGSRFFPLRVLRFFFPIPAWVYFAAALSLLGWIALRRSSGGDAAPGQFLEHGNALIGTFQVLTTPRYPWYFAWLAPFLCFYPRSSWLYLSGACAVVYLFWLEEQVPGISLWLGCLQYFPVYVLLARDYFAKRATALDGTNPIQMTTHLTVARRK